MQYSLDATGRSNVMARQSPVKPASINERTAQWQQLGECCGTTRHKSFSTDVKVREVRGKETRIWLCRGDSFIC